MQQLLPDPTACNMRESASECGAQAAALVLAQQGTPDTRTLQTLDPLVTLQELHAKLWVNVNSSKDQANALNISFPGAAAGKGKAWISRQTSATSRRSARSGRSLRSASGAAGAARPFTSLSAKQQVPEYVNPMLWAAALQQEALQNQPSVVQDAKLSNVLDLQHSVLEQIQQYKQLAPQLQVHQLQHPQPYLRAVRKLPPGTYPFAQQQSPPAAAAQPLQQSPPAAASQAINAAGSAAAASTATVGALPLQQVTSLAGRLEAACQQVIQELPGLSADTTPHAAHPAATTRRHQQHTHRSLAGHKPPKTSRVQIISSNGSTPRPRLLVGTPSAAGSLRPPLILTEQPASQTGAASWSPGTCLSAVMGAGARGSSCDDQAAALAGGLAGTPAARQLQQAAPAEQLQQMQPPDYAAVPFKLQHLRLEVQPPGGSPRVQGAKTARSPGSRACQSRGEAAKAGPPLAVLQAQLPPDAAEALKAASAASTDTHLQRYRAHLLDAQQQLLARELADSNPQQPGHQQKQDLQHVHAGRHSSSAVGALVAAAAAGGAACGAAANLSTSQLVAKLAQQDVQRDEHHTTDGPGAEASSHTAAVNQRVAAASSLSELLDAANEHLRLTAQSSGFKLDIGRIARLHKFGKQWRGSDASARSNGSGTGRGDGSSTGPSTARTQDSSAPATSRSHGRGARQSTGGVDQPVVPRPVPPAAVVGASAAAGAAGAARSSIMSSAVRGSMDSCLPAQASTLTDQARRVSMLASQQASTASLSVGPAWAGGARVSCASSVAPAGAGGPRASCASSVGPVGCSAATGDGHSTRSADLTRSSSVSSRLPPPMKVPPPQLHAPSRDEVAALPMPSLPQLLDLSHEPVKVLQARLKRVWEVLGVPAETQLDMVLRYTSRAAAGQFETVLEAWEAAAAAVLQREALLAQVMQLEAAVADCRQMQQQQQMPWHNSTQLHAAGGEGCTAGQLGLSVQQVRQLLWAFLAAEQQVELAAQGLLAATGQQLLVDCCAYPPEESCVAVAQLQQLLVEAWVATGSGSS